MPLGDSLTAFGESYRGPLYRTLKAEGLNIDFVGSGQWEPVGGGDPDGEGHGGFRIGPDDSVDYQGKPANLDAYIAEWLNSARPNVVLLTIGTNDLAAGGPIANAAAGKLQNLVTKIRQLAPNAYLVVGDIPPNTNTSTISPPAKAIDDVARRVGDGSDPKITYGNTAQHLLDAGYTTAVHTNDGTHFTVEGGVLFAKAWYPKARGAIRAACGM
jgi:lysophospholipase L1-like esterase